MELIEKHIKYWTVYLGVIYAVGFLILSTRLSFLEIYIKDFLTLDYLKAGILFLFVNLPIALIIYQTHLVADRKNIVKFLISIFGGALWFILLSPTIFQHKEGSQILLNVLTFVVYPIIVYPLVVKGMKIRSDLKEKDILGLGMQVVIGLIVITSFSNIIFPQIQFRFGGGAPYNKTLLIENEDKTISTIDAKIYYENDKWIHMIDDNKVISLPKNKVIKQQSELKDDKFMEMLR